MESSKPVIIVPPLTQEPNMMTDDGASMAADVAIQTAQGFAPREAMRISILGREGTHKLGSKWRRRRRSRSRHIECLLNFPHPSLLTGSTLRGEANSDRSVSFFVSAELCG